MKLKTKTDVTLKKRY